MKKILGILLLLLFSSAFPLMAAEKAVVMVLACHNFRDEEFFTPQKILSKAGFKVEVASVMKGELTGLLGGKVKAGKLISELKLSDYRALIFIGGPGAREYWDDPTAHRLAQEAVKQKMVLAAICIAPVTLAKAGVLKGKKATVWAGEKNQLIKAGAKYLPQELVIDGKIITAPGPEAAGSFGQAILNALAKP